MSLYSYKAINGQGKIARGLEDAANVVDLELRLKRMGLDLIHARIDEKKPAFGSKKIRRSDLITFFFNLEQLLRAGVPLLECLGDLRDSMDDLTFREIIASMIESIQSGKKLSQAMAEHSGVFDKISTSLTHAGEESGRLSDVFGQLTEALKWQDEMISQTKNMMVYPAFVGTVIAAVAFFLLTYLVPQLVIFLRSMEQDIPIQTRMLLAASDVFANYWYLILGLPVLLGAAVKLLAASSTTMQYHLDNLKLHIWPTGPILRKIIMARFANTFAIMYGSGIAILDCIANSRGLVNNQVVAQNLDRVMQEIESGKNLTQSFQSTGVFPPLVIRMLKVGETTGQLDLALRNVSYFYDRDVKDSIKKVQAMIEPGMTIVLGLLLGWIMLSVLSPIYDIISRVQV